jgi:hypothetical protein
MVEKKRRLSDRDDLNRVLREKREENKAGVKGL